MNRYIFAARNIFDKIKKGVNDRKLLKYYLYTYFIKNFKNVSPDIYVISYPKCGRTWLRTILQRYLELVNKSVSIVNHSPFFLSIENLVIKFDHCQGNWVPAPKSIDNMYFNKKKYLNKKVVFLARDPRDVLVSSWYHLKYRDQVYRNDLSSFIRDRLVGINKIIAYMNLWIENMHFTGDFFLVTYERLHDNPIESLIQLFAFLGVKVDLNCLKSAVEECSFNKMKEKESNGYFDDPWIKRSKNGRENSTKIRKGKVGGYIHEFSKQDIRFLDQLISGNLSRKLPY